jgi:hypothetical protein
MFQDSLREPIAYKPPPDQRFQEMLGDVSLSILFTPEVMQAAQSLVDEARLDFFKTLQPLLDQLRIPVYDQKDGAKDIDADFCVMVDILNTIRDEARLLGFPFIVNISTHMLKLFNSTGYHMPKSRALMTHLETVLRLAFSEKIQDEGGEIGKNLLSSLNMD